MMNSLVFVRKYARCRFIIPLQTMQGGEGTQNHDLIRLIMPWRGSTAFTI